MQNPPILEKRYGLLSFIGRYLLYRFRSGNRHSVHSPSIFQLLETLRSPRDRSPFRDIELLRTAYRANQSTLNIVDHGSGGITKETSVSRIAKTSLKPKRLAETIARISQHFKVHNALELGTSLGITSSYIARSISGQLYTFEGDSKVLKIARNGWKQIGIDNIKSYQGAFESSLLETLPSLPEMGLVFIDGHHQKQATLSYFKQLLTVCGNDSVIIMDDIHWSKGMEEAWLEIKQMDQVTCTVDLFWIGLVFLKKELSKEHFVLRF